ncbi:hypothetical protein GALMADRAFT_63887 [Galerina marginata CBS 339.88]|uniref:Calcineurin-like phosphoesterase domain-containing protein n=1 Tax=Galerina marginata (strain CBS 339.88) TaxID=685588 RepID=A0A067TIZ9_GALM3|nr:hypothetical protein GALMADRAFT_63887 [Galerina marginata CBS 339.88]
MSLDSILHRRPQTPWEQFLKSPLAFYAELFYKSCRKDSEQWISSRLTKSPSVRVVCISDRDTHNRQELQPSLPVGDILIRADERAHFTKWKPLLHTWLNRQSHPHKIFIAGNHDSCLYNPGFKDSLKDKFSDLVYLQERSVSLQVNGRELTFYGSPFTPQRGPWSFQYPRTTPSLDTGENDIWSSIPNNVDVLITHGPPRYHLDFRSGCIGLLWRVRPKLHIFGHIHAARETEILGWTKDQKAYERILSRTGGW